MRTVFFAILTSLFLFGLAGLSFVIGHSVAGFVGLGLMLLLSSAFSYFQQVRSPSINTANAKSAKTLQMSEDVRI